MNKYIVGIDGMGCGMCEIHVEDAVRKAFHIKKAKASHFKNNLVVFSEEDLVEDDFNNAFKDTGYRITSFAKAPAIKKLFGWR